MSFTYESLINNPRSEKGLLCHIEPAQRILEWVNHSGFIYKKVVPFYVIRLKQGNVEATKVLTLAALNSAGKFYFDGNTKTLYFWANGNVDPSTINSIVFYRIGFSTFPFNGPIEDSSDKEIEYIPTITGVPTLSHKLDHVDQIGISLSSSSRISFILEDFFIENYDLLFWENKRVRVYSHFPQLSYSEKRLYFDGRVTDKSLSKTTVDLTITDFLDVLKEDISLEVVTEADGEFSESFLGNAKRRVYGRVSGLRLVSTNQILEGFQASGTYTAALGGSVITGIGSSLLSELSPEDKIIFNEDEYKVQSIDSNTSFTVSETVDRPINSETMLIRPEVQSIRTGRNTEWLIAGHALKQASSTITEVIQRNRLRLSDAGDFEANDFVSIGGVSRQLRRVSTDNVVTLTQSLTSDPALATSVTKNPVQRVFANGLSYLIDRDYSVDNQITGCKLIFDTLAEFNVAIPLDLGGSATFTNGSRTVSFSLIEVKTNFKSRDWIKPKSASFSTWYEILSIDEESNQVTLRLPFSGSFSGTAQHKNISPIGDETVLTCECFGKTEDGTATGVHIKTASQVVKDIVTESGIVNELNTDSFEMASIVAPQLMSLAIPLDFNSKPPKIQDILEVINKSVFGSLHYNSEFEIEYNILSPDKPAVLPEQIITDSDIMDWSVTSTSKNIVKRIIGNYRHQDADRFTSQPSTSVIEWTNEFVEQIVEGTAFEEVNIYLWNTLDAEIMIQRKAFINEISQSILKISAPIKYATKSINDKLMVQFDRLYGRLGSQLNGLDKRKIVIISGVDKSETTVELECDDLGNIWNRCANIAANDSLDFNLSGDEKILNGYIADSDDLVDNLQETYRLNLIG